MIYFWTAGFQGSTGRIFSKIKTNNGTFLCGSLVIATGGLSYANLGATGFGHQIAEKFGLRVTAFKTGPCPFNVQQGRYCELQRVERYLCRVKISCNKKNFTGICFLLTRAWRHRLVLQISSYWNNRDAVHIDLLPDIDIYSDLIEKRQSRIEMKNLLAGHFPKRFINKWCEMYISSKPMCQYTDREIEDIVERLKNWEIKPAGTEGYSNAEVTLGGVDTDGLSSKTMEAKKVQGLYFIGEVLDVTGQLGGYNLQWAWSSGYAAGQFV